MEKQVYGKVEMPLLANSPHMENTDTIEIDSSVGGLGTGKRTRGGN